MLNSAQRLTKNDKNLITRLASKQGRVINNEIDNGPELFEVNLFYYNAFYLLSRDRQTGYSIGYIPFSSMKMYCDDLRLDDVERDDLYYIISQVDYEFVNNINKKQEVAHGKANSRSSKRH